MDKSPISGMQTVPYGLPLMMDAWLGCLLWHSYQKGCADQFKKDTGLDIRALLRRTPIETIIDEATGHEKTTITAWADWITKNIWGEKERNER